MRTTSPAAESREEMEAVAADFLQRRRFAGWSETDQAELDAWLKASEARRIAFWRLEGVLTRFERLAALRTPDRRRKSRVASLRFAVPFLAIAAAFGVAVVLGTAAERYLSTAPDRSYSTDIGGRTLLSFADHTQIELNTNTAIRFRMTGEERTVWLERGEAWFHVSHDASRPFNVIVGQHRVTDLGTEFLVRRGADGMQVALLSGKATLSTQGAQSAVLNSGDEATATPVSMSVVRRTPQQLADELAWQRGVLVFRNTKLADVVREFNRYNETKLVIADPSIANVKVSATLKTDDFGDFLHLAETIMALRVDREGNSILISRASKNSGRHAP